ncbi:MAG: hypothetical protein D6737_11690 [Chloroflexi bacterium]|nr:MAG: hypothetical protein D6737_11690 [Chloroflexota bacterium]
MNNQLIDTWQIHNRILFYLLDAVKPEALTGVPQGMKGRSVAQLFAHIHNVRLLWLEAATPELMSDVRKIPMKTKAERDAIDLDTLRTALRASNHAMEALLADGFERGRVKNFKPHAAAFFGYMLAHEWYHVGEICMTLTQAGHRLDDSVLYGIWEWGAR